LLDLDETLLFGKGSTTGANSVRDVSDYFSLELIEEIELGEDLDSGIGVKAGEERGIGI